MKFKVLFSIFMLLKAILRNKKRVNAKKNSIHAFKLMDTIFLKPPSGVNVKESSLSAW